jgi:hypothetical protein
MFSVGITVNKEVDTQHVIETVEKMGWGTLFDSARIHSGSGSSDYIELHFNEATSIGMEMNDTLQQGNVILHDWTFSYTITLDEWRVIVEKNKCKKIYNSTSNQLY